MAHFVKGFKSKYTALLKVVFSRKQLFMLTIIITSAVLAGVFEAKTMIYFNQFFQNLEENDTNLLLITILFYLLFFLLDTIVSFIRDYSTDIAKNGLILTLREKSFNKLLAGKWEEIDAINRGNTNEIVLGDVDRFANSVWKDWINLISNLCISVALIIGLYIIAGLTIMIIVVFSVVPLIYIQKKYASKIGKLSSFERISRGDFIQSFFNLKEGIFSYRAIRKENWLKDRTMGKLKKLNDDSLRITKTASFGELISEGIYVLIIVLICISGGLLVTQGVLATATFITVFMYVGRVSFSLQSIYDNIVSILKNSPSVSHLARFINIIDNENINQYSNVKISTIQLKDISYQYPNAKNKAFNNIDFEINHDDKVVTIMGRSGSGKTTLLEVLLKIRSYEGSILVSGKELSQVSKAGWLSEIGFVPQIPYIMNDSILNNVAFGRNVTLKEVKQAITEVNLDNWVSDLSQGLDSIIGTGAVSPSGGQIKRIALARAIVCKPNLIILDEPTANLDIESQQKILEIINSTKEDIKYIITSHDHDFVRQVSCKKLVL